MNRTTAALSGTALGIVLSTTQLAGHARGDNFGSLPRADDPLQPAVALADGKHHEYSLHTSNPTVRLATHQAALYQLDPTAMIVNQWSDNTTADMMISEVTYQPAYPIGVHACLAGTARWGNHPNLACDEHSIKINTGPLATPFGHLRIWDDLDEMQRKYVLTHEMGHSVGLRHTNGTGAPYSAMTTGSIPQTGYSAHDKTHLFIQYTL